MKKKLLLAMTFCFAISLQAQTSKTISEIKTGELAAALTSDELNQTTELIITDTIDARDFVTMRDSMPSLESIDLSAAVIAEYSGTEGTLSRDTSYKENMIPTRAFCSSFSSTNYNLTTITLPTTITGIGNYAFSYCYYLKTTIPALVTQIGTGAFVACDEITVEPTNTHFVSLDGVLFTADKDSLLHCNRTQSNKYVIPSTVTTILESAFETCEYLTDIEIPASVKTIDNYSFFDCSYLESIQVAQFIDLSKSEDVFGNVDGINCKLSVLSGTKDNFIADKNWKIFDNIYILEGATQVSAGELSTILGTEIKTITKLILTGTIDARDFVTMRDSMPLLADIDLSNATIVEYSGNLGTQGTDSYDYWANTIPASAFYNGSTENINIKTIVMPNTLDTIGPMAFMGCTAIDSLVVPASVTTIKDYAFYMSGNVVVDENNPEYCAIDGVLFDKDTSILFTCPTKKTGTYTIPSTVMTLRHHAFYNCVNLSSIEMPASVANVNDYAFYGCGAIVVADDNNDWSSVNGVLFNNDTTSLQYYPWTNPTTYNIPASVERIEYGAFDGNQKLTSISIPPSVSYIAGNAFADCIGLTTIKMSSFVDLSKASTTVFPNVNTSNVTLFVPAGTKSQFAAAAQWKEFANIVEYAVSSSKSTISIAAKPTTTSTASITANTSWTAQSSESWLVVSPTSKTGNGSLVFTATDNLGSTPRSATVTIDGLYANQLTITVTQAIAIADTVLTISDATAKIAAKPSAPTLITVTSNTDWTAMSNQNWLTLDPATNNGNATLSLTASENTTTSQRTATVTIAGKGFTTQTIAVTQAAGEPSLSINTTTVNVKAKTDTSATIMITSNSVWTVSSDQTWASATSSTKNGNATVVLRAKENSIATIRTAIFSFFINGVLFQKVTLTQAAGTDLLKVDKSTVSLNAKGNTSTSLQVIASTAWLANSDKTWLSISPASQTGNASITLTATENTTTSLRTATISFVVNNATVQTVSLTQAAGEPFLSIDKLEIDLLAKTDTSKTIEVSSNTSWTTTSDRIWITVTPEQFDGSASVKIAAAENKTAKVRTATVNFMINDIIVKSVSVTQAAGNQTDLDTLDNLLIDLCPNPATTEFRIINCSVAQLSIYNSAGELIEKKQVANNERISIEALPVGLYTVVIDSQNKSIQRKLIKK